MKDFTLKQFRLDNIRAAAEGISGISRVLEVVQQLQNLDMTEDAQDLLERINNGCTLWELNQGIAALANIIKGELDEVEHAEVRA